MEETIQLSPIDQAMPRTIVRWLIHFDVEPEQREPAATSLEQSFAILLREMPLLGGWVKETDNDDGKLQIQVVPNHPQNRFRIRDFGSSEPVEIVNFVPTEHCIMPNYDVDVPTFTAQASLHEEGLSLCFCILHAIVDAVGMGLILQRWSEHCRHVTDGTWLSMPKPLDK